MTATIFAHDFNRYTLTAPIRMEGIGLHSGQPSSVTILPGLSGLRVHDIDQLVEFERISVERTPRCTRLRLPSGRGVDMVEHLFAALRICGITDADIKFETEEVPVLDGSAGLWLDMFENVGLMRVAGPAECLVLMDTISLEVGGSTYLGVPGAFSLDCSIDFPNDHIGHQAISVDGRRLRTLARARTFVMEHEIAALKAHNLALGGSLDNAVVVGAAGPLNKEGFRMPDECVRHKALDFIGDLNVKGRPVIGKFKVSAPGHSANNVFVEAMLSSGKLRKISVHPSERLSLAA